MSSRMLCVTSALFVVTAGGADPSTSAWTLRARLDLLLVLAT
jgi:hypothetical protein